uniref:Uncharacterized protein n=1 Tax=Anguilla anguilla TaxID=7936 RepID=A0A0E9W9E2_ANGAN
MLCGHPDEACRTSVPAAWLSETQKALRSVAVLPRWTQSSVSLLAEAAAAAQ